MSDPVDPGFFRTVLGHFPTGVTAVTAISETGTPVGMAIGSFTSVSLEPPLVAFLPGKTSSSWLAMKDAGAFCVNVMSADQLAVCGVMASKFDDKFAEVQWRAGETGSPIIEGSLAWIDCDTEAVYDGGDHDIVVGRVRSMWADTDTETGPLLFFRGAYGNFDRFAD